MQTIQTIAKSAINFTTQSAVIGMSFVGLGFVAGPMSALAESGMPDGYTLSPKQIGGQHCYRHNNEVNLYCYPYKLTESMMMKHNSMMKDSMMKKDNTMMNHDSMMKKDDSMMKKDDTMMNHDSMTK